MVVDENRHKGPQGREHEEQRKPFNIRARPLNVKNKEEQHHRSYEDK